MDVPIGPDRSPALSPALDAPTPGLSSLPDRLAAAVDADPVAQSQALALREAYGAENVPDVLAAVHAGGPGALADLTAQPERYGAFAESPQAREALAMLAGTLPNMDGYGGINTVLTSIPRPGEARDATSPDASAVRTVETSPDVEMRTLNPPGVYITGPDAEATFQALDRYSALDLARDSATGRVTASPLTVEQEGALNARDRFLLQALNGWKTDVTLETTRSNTAPDLSGTERQVVIGRYDGSQVDATTDQVSARNVFNLRHARALNRAAGTSVGGSVAHEIVEAYAGARGFPGGSYADGFRQAHLGAEALDDRPRSKWAISEETRENSNQILIGIQADSDRSTPGFESYTVLYVDPLRHARLDASGVALRHPDGSLVADPGPPTSLVPPR